MKIKKVKSKRKGIMDVSEINAYKLAYGKPLDYRDYFVYVGIPSLFLGGLSFVLFYYWWLSLICALIGFVYGLKVIMPKTVRRSYELRSLQERNKFVNNMTQILTDQSKTIQKALSLATDRLKGELKEDLTLLSARIHGSNSFQVARAFKELSNKYENDVVFSQYLEQLETSISEGRNNVDTLKQIKSYHNDIIKKTTNFLKMKEGHLADMKQIMFIIALFLGAIVFSFSFDMYFDSFSRSVSGWISGGLYMVLMAMFILKFFRLYFDDEIMSVGGNK